MNPALDVDQIVADLQDRVAGRLADGDYDQRILDARFRLMDGRIALRPELAYSAKPVIGVPLTAAKKLLIRLQLHFLNDLVAQVNAELATQQARLDAEVRRGNMLEKRIRALEASRTEKTDG